MGRSRLRFLGVGNDISIAVVLQGVGALIAFAYQTVLLRNLSRPDADIYFLVIAFVTLAGAVGDAGLVATITPRLAISGTRPTPAYRASLQIRFWALMVGLLTMCAVLPLIGRTDLVLYAAIAYLSLFVSAKATGMRQSFELIWRLRGRTYAISALSVIDSILGLAALILLAWFDSLSLLSAVIVLTVSSIPGFLGISIVLFREFRQSGLFHQRLPRRIYRSLLMATMPVALLVFFGQISGQLETFVLAATSLGKGEIAAYNAGIRPLTALMFVATTLSYGMAPLLTRSLKGNGVFNTPESGDSLPEFLVSVSVRILGVVSLVVCAVSWVGADQLMRIFGEEYRGEGYILQIYSIVSALVFLVILFDQFLLAVGKRKQTLYGAILQVGVALLLEWVAITAFGIRGMLAAKAISFVVLLGFQIGRFVPSLRQAAFSGLLRLVPPSAGLALAVGLSGNLPMVVRGVVVLVATLATVLLFRTLKLNEFQTLRRLSLISR